MGTLRLTAAQALVRYLGRQMTEVDGARVPLFAGIWAIFGHGNVSGMGEALHGAQDSLPTLRAHNEQGMAQCRRRVRQGQPPPPHDGLHVVDRTRRHQYGDLGRHRPCEPTSGAVHPRGRVRHSATPIPCFSSWRFGVMARSSANDCFRPVSRYFDRIVRPEQIMPALERALAVLTDPADCGPVTLAFCQDVQAEAYDYPRKLLRGAAASHASPSPGCR